MNSVVKLMNYLILWMTKYSIIKQLSVLVAACHFISNVTWYLKKIKIININLFIYVHALISNFYKGDYKSIFWSVVSYETNINVYFAVKELNT